VTPLDPKPTLALGDLRGPQGNAFAILGAVASALRRAGASRETVEEFRREATAADYRHLLAVVDEWFAVVRPVYVPGSALNELERDGG
jgi:hypothetical protein